MTRPLRSTVPDDVLIGRALDGDLAAVVALLDRYRPTIETVCMGVARDEGKDAIQNLAIALPKKLRSFDRGRSFEPWIRRVAYNEALQMIRRRQIHERRAERYATVVDLHPADPDLAQRVQAKVVLAEVLQGLSDSAREVVVRYYIDGQTHEEIAEDLFISPVTVRTRLQRARRRAAVIARQHGWAVELPSHRRDRLA